MWYFQTDFSSTLKSRHINQKGSTDKQGIRIELWPITGADFLKFFGNLIKST
jgi:hypothetical protein